jgi:plastocyanin
MRSRRPGLLWLVGAAVACGGGGSGPGPTPSSVTASAGENQAGAAGAPLATALEVTVKDGSGSPLANITVHWAAATGGGSVAPLSNQTGSDGKATATRTLGVDTVQQTTTATVSGVTPATFHHIGRIQGATQIALSGGSPQTDTVLATLSTQISVLVRDETSAPVPGVNVTWSPPPGGKVNGAASTTTATNGSGIAVVSVTLGPTAGNQTPKASVTGLIGSPVSFTATAAAGHAVNLDPVAGNASGAPGTIVTLSVKATDAHGNVSAGDTVAWDTTAGGGSVNPDSSVTAANGVASTQHTLGPAVGLDSVIATAFGDTVRFGLTIVSAPLQDTVTVGPGVVFAPTAVTIASGGTVVFRWAAGSILHGVQWLTAPGGATLPTKSNDMTTGTYSVDLTTPGTYTYNCTIHGSSMSGSVIVQ